MKGTVSKILVNLMISVLLFSTAVAAEEERPIPDVNAGQLINQNKTQMEHPELKQPDESKAIETTPEKIQGAAEKRKMYIRGYQLHCPIDIPEQDLRAMLKPYIEIAGTTDDMQAAAGKIVDYLRAQGYFLATGAVADQPVADFIYPMYIFPGRISSMAIDNRSGVSDSVIAMQFGELKNGDYIKKNQVERGMAYVNELQGQVAQLQVSPGKNMGDYDLKILSVPTKRWLSRTGVDNNGSISLGRWEANETVLLTNLTGRGDSFGVTISGAPYWNVQSQTGKNVSSNNFGQSYLNVWWNTPAFTPGGKINVTLLGQNYRQWNVYNGAYVDPMGWATNVSIGYEHSLVRTPTDNLRLSLAYESKLNNDYSVYYDINGAWVDSEVNDLLLTAKYNWSDSLFGGGQNFALASVEAGYISSFDERKAKTLGEYYGKYGILSGDISRTQYLPANFQLLLSANGQAPDEDLAPSEKMSITGLNGVRAYPYSNTSADIGAVGSAELQYFPEFLTNGVVTGVRLSAFFDAGVMKTNFSQPYDKRINYSIVNTRYLPVYNGQDLYGYGVGANFVIWNVLNATVQYALPVAPPACYGKQYDSGQIWFNANLTF